MSRTYEEQMADLRTTIRGLLRLNGNFRSDLTFALTGTRQTLTDDQILSTASRSFAASFDTLAGSVHQTAKEKGWWDDPRNDGELIALIHSELSEALEGLRHGNPPDDKIPEFNAAEAELADVIIRIADMAAARGWRVGDAVLAKAEMNKGRDRKHGGKVF